MTDKTTADHQAAKDRQTLLSAARNAAVAALIAAHLDEFNGFMEYEAKTRRVEWKPRLSLTQKARAELKALLDAHPEFVKEIAESAGYMQ